MAVITIARELGSEGDKIAELLCQELGCRRVDKEILAQIAEDAGVDVETVLAKERRPASRPKLVSAEMTALYRKDPSAFRNKSVLDDQTYQQLLQQTMEQFAQAGNAVIVGRGGQMVLRDWPAALHVRLYAPIEARVQCLVERLNISAQEAERRLTRSDEQKREYIRQMHQYADWASLKHYHVIINTAAIAPEVASQMIILAARHKENEGG